MISSAIWNKYKARANFFRLTKLHEPVVRDGGVEGTHTQGKIAPSKACA